jgi:hypothetical protein
VTCDRFVRNSGFEAQIIADLRPILRVPPGQRYRGASGGLPGDHSNDDPLLPSCEAIVHGVMIPLFNK